VALESAAASLALELTRMPVLDLAAVKPDPTVLEVGTGSGYQAAILAHLARKVCTVEIIPQLAEAAAKVLRDLDMVDQSRSGVVRRHSDRAPSLDRSNHKAMGQRA
jgi:protein-L-isoaspartate O-methyltransferase